MDLFSVVERLVLVSSGSSADHILCCLTRDSYGTHHFLQQLMTVLSLLEKAPSPEPSEQDFYTQFGNKSTGTSNKYIKGEITFYLEGSLGPSPVGFSKLVFVATCREDAEL